MTWLVIGNASQLCKLDYSAFYLTRKATSFEDVKYGIPRHIIQMSHLIYVPAYDGFIKLYGGVPPQNLLFRTALREALHSLPIGRWQPGSEPNPPWEGTVVTNEGDFFAYKERATAL